MKRSKRRIERDGCGCFEEIGYEVVFHAKPSCPIHGDEAVAKIRKEANALAIPDERFERIDWREIPKWAREYIVDLEDIVGKLRDDGGWVAQACGCGRPGCYWCQR